MSKEHLCVTLVPLFNHLPAADLAIINGLARHRHVVKGQQIISPTEAGQLVIIASGSMKMYQLSPSGKEQLLRVVEPGGYEGENFLFGAENDALFGEALEDSQICLLRYDDLHELLLSHPQLSLKLLEINAQKNAKLEQQAQFLMMERVDQRLATYLLDLAKASESTTVTIPMKMKELASFLGTTPEALSRTMRALGEAQLIARDNYQVNLLKSDELEEI